MQKKSKRFLPESFSKALKALALRIIGAGLFFGSLVFIAAFFIHDPWLSGFGVASNFGTQSIIGNVISAGIYGVGWLPSLFILLYVARASALALLGNMDESPEYDAIRAIIAIGVGAAGMGAIAPDAGMGGIAGAVIAHDIGLFAGRFTFVFGVLFIALFLYMAGVLLRIKIGTVLAVVRLVGDYTLWLASELRLIEYRPRPKMVKYVEEKYEEEEEQEEIKPRRRPPLRSPGATSAATKKPTPRRRRVADDDYELPPPEFLEKSIFSRHAVTSELKNTASAMEVNFEQYGVFGKVMGIKPGPIVTLYEFEPADGMRIKNITDTVKDMTRAMAAENIRIAAIPRTKYIGVEMVNMGRATVRFQTLVTNQDFIHSRYHIPLALGVDIGGHPVYFDLAKMPHVLIAGRTGSGKSVFVQSIIMSILYRFRPDECKLVIVDPKGVDFTLWRDIPHLITPVVTDANQAVNALKWTVREMEERYKKLKDVGVQNIEGYNEEAQKLRAKGKVMTKQVPVGTDSETGELEFEEREIDLSDIPYLVVIIDEVADLMSVARKEVEACVQRLAQKARAAGIHLVMATQRPDTSVITGVIKANFPTRISFQARSNIDSMTTLGEKGAEQLLACGDMLFSEAGRVPVRIHGAFIENKEINKVANFLRTQGEPEYVEGVGDSDDFGGEFITPDMGGGAGADYSIPGMPQSKAAKDGDLYRQAVEYVTRDKKPTISYIQRRLGIGYNKAATFIERMEAERIVSPPDANNKRHIL
ncbi:MAG: FtsK/SpoIIIE domain-containing protein [Alphaproteobacteria bacterium]|nr:FtsK/SpoIIIE domain-containing protein [Alphaproteobacteria bacterium]MCL2758210.1 FtsK/SpoIIIE domain-containing protein [Alphaproteobacteria bacterium]